MTNDGEDRSHGDEEGYSGFVFGSGRPATDGGSTRREWLYRVGSVLVVIGLLVAGVYPYVLFADPIDLNRIEAQLEEGGAVNGTDRPVDADNSTTATVSTERTTVGETSVEVTESASMARDSTTTDPRTGEPRSDATAVTSETTVTTVEPTTGKPTTGALTTGEPPFTEGEPTSASVSDSTRTPVTVEEPTATAKPDELEEPTTTGEITTADETDEPPITEEPTTDTIESRAPSIDDFSVTDERNGETSETGDTVAFEVGWQVSDPDGDLRTVQVNLIEDPNGDARIIDERTVAVGGSKASGTTRFAVEGKQTSRDAYELQIRVEDEAGNVVLRTTREVADG